jgi:hypothetical protein
MPGTEPRLVGALLVTSDCLPRPASDQRVSGSSAQLVALSLFEPALPELV